MPSAESICLPGNRIEALESPSKVERIYFFTGFLNMPCCTRGHTSPGEALESSKVESLLYSFVCVEYALLQRGRTQYVATWIMPHCIVTSARCTCILPVCQNPVGIPACGDERGYNNVCVNIRLVYMQKRIIVVYTIHASQSHEKTTTTLPSAMICSHAVNISRRQDSNDPTARSKAPTTPPRWCRSCARRVSTTRPTCSRAQLRSIQGSRLIESLCLAFGHSTTQRSATCNI